MDECKEQFEKYCKKVNVRPYGDYGQDVYEFWQAAWNRRASPVSVPEVTDGMALAFHRALTDGSIGQEEIDEIKTGLSAALAAAPTPPSTEDRKDAELWRDLVSHQKFNNVPAVGYAINQAKKRQAMQEDRP